MADRKRRRRSKSSESAIGCLAPILFIAWIISANADQRQQALAAAANLIGQPPIVAAIAFTIVLVAIGVFVGALNRRQANRDRAHLELHEALRIASIAFVRLTPKEFENEVARLLAARLNCGVSVVGGVRWWSLDMMIRYSGN